MLIVSQEKKEINEIKLKFVHFEVNSNIFVNTFDTIKLSHSVSHFYATVFFSSPQKKYKIFSTRTCFFVLFIKTNPSLDFCLLTRKNKMRYESQLSEALCQPRGS